jgi:hypothetical protein
MSDYSVGESDAKIFLSVDALAGEKQFRVGDRNKNKCEPLSILIE